MKHPAAMTNDDLGRAVYLMAGAISTGLRARGCADERLYPDHHTPLALWAGVNRSNMLTLMKLMVEVIRESDRRRGVLNPRGIVRFLRARDALGAAVQNVRLLPLGFLTGEPPLEI